MSGHHDDKHQNSWPMPIMAFFKSLLLLACLSCVSCVSDEMLEMIQMLHNNCVQKTGVKEESITKARKGDFEAKNQKLQCYMKCLMQETAGMSEDGTIDVETIIATIPEEIAGVIGPAVKKCKDSPGKNPCEKAMKFNQCVYAIAPKEFFLP